MKKTRILFILILLGAAIGVNAQGAKSKSLKYTVAGLKVDERVKVGNFSFARRYANDATGEYLEVIFDMKNYTDDPIDLEVYLIGLWEEDNVNAKKRNRIPYPTWRERDYDKEIFHVKYVDTIPVIDKFTVNSELKSSREYPSMMDYVNYIEKTAKGGVAFTLPGLAKGKLVTVSGKNYQIQAKNLEALFVGRLQTVFSNNYYFFNHLGIFIKDTKENKTVFRQFFRFKREMKAY